MKVETITTALMLTATIVAMIPNQGRSLKSPWPISATFSTSAKPIMLNHFHSEPDAEHLRESPATNP